MKLLPGLELFYNSIGKDLKSKNEAILVLLHYTLICNGYNCIGLDEQFEENASESKGSELLPASWNKNDFFILRYVELSKKDLLLVTVIPSDSILLVNFLLKNKDKINATSIDPNKFITDNYKEFKNLFANEDLLKKFVDEIKVTLDAMDSKTENTKKKSTSTSEQRNTDPLLVDEPRRNFPPNPAIYNPSQQSFIPNPTFPQVGGADLDPLGRGIGGGMLMDPRSLEENFNNPLRINPIRFDPSSGLAQPLPPGAVPPGARFEYFGPPRRPTNRPNLRGPNHPDLEHFDSNYDNMFM